METNSELATKKKVMVFNVMQPAVMVILQFFMHMPTPKGDLDKGMSPLHAHCLFLLDHLKEKYHLCGVDKLFTFAKFFCDAFVSKKQVCRGSNNSLYVR
jgi:hypothetical protein